MTNNKLRVGACSLASKPGEIDDNLKEIKQWCSKATAEGIQLLLFPELSLSGYWLSHELFQRAQPRDCPAVHDLSAFLGKLDTKMAVSIGLAEKHGGCIYNCQILVDRKGERYYYRKAHWPPEETPFWSLGDHYPVHRFGDFIIGTTICYDNNFPEIHRIYGLQGTDLVLAPYAYGKKFDLEDPESVKASIFDWKNREKMYLRASAAANYHWIVACVGAGHIKDHVSQEKPGEGQEYFLPGCILFIDPEGIVVKESPDDTIEERLLWYDINLNRNMEVRMTGHNHFKNRRTATYDRLIELP